MAKADKWRRIADRFRDMPGQFGLREYEIELRATTYTGQSVGDGSAIVDVIPLRMRNGTAPKVRFPSQREIALGMASIGSCFVGPFTPDYGTGGIPRSLFDGSHPTAGAVETGQMLQIYLKGPAYPTGCLFREVKVNTDHALQVTLELLQAEPTLLPYG